MGPNALVILKMILFLFLLIYTERKWDTLKIPKPTGMAYPGYVTDATKIPVLNLTGYTTARVGGNRAYHPAYDGSWYIPGFTLDAHHGNDAR